MLQAIFLIGFGKIVNGLLSVRILERLKPMTVFIVGVRKTVEWIDRRNAHSTFTSKVYSYDDKLLCETEWIFSHETESFTDFCNRCHSSNRPGIWLYADSSELLEATEAATVVATSVGVDGLSDILKAISQSTSHKTVYAFENQPAAIQALAQNYPDVSVIPCPIDRVVVKREFDDIKGEVSVKHGFDPSESILIYDKDGIWKNLLHNLEKTSITLVNDATLLARALKKKANTKNIVHKYASQLAIYLGNLNYQVIRDQPLCKLLNDEWVAYIKSFRLPIIVAAVVDALSLWTTYTQEFCHELFDEFSGNFDVSMDTVLTDPSDSIGRIVHLETAKSTIQDCERLVNIFNSLKKALEANAEAEAFRFLSEIGVNLSAESAAHELNRITEILEQNIQNTK